MAFSATTLASNPHGLGLLLVGCSLHTHLTHNILPPLWWRALPARCDGGGIFASLIIMICTHMHTHTHIGWRWGSATWRVLSAGVRDLAMFAWRSISLPDHGSSGFLCRAGSRPPVSKCDKGAWSVSAPCHTMRWNVECGPVARRVSTWVLCRRAGYPGCPLKKGGPRETGNRAAKTPRTLQCTEHLREFRL